MPSNRELQQTLKALDALVADKKQKQAQADVEKEFKNLLNEYSPKETPDLSQVVDALKQAISQVQVNPNVNVNVPEIKSPTIPEIKMPQIPGIDTSGIEKAIKDSLAEGLKNIPSPKSPDVKVNVPPTPAPQVNMPDQMNVTGNVGLSGIDRKNPLPVMHVDSKGNPVQQTVGGGPGGIGALAETIATTGLAIPTKGIALVGTDGTNARVLKLDSSGNLILGITSVTVSSITGTTATNIVDSTGVAFEGSNPLPVVLGTSTNTIGSVKITDGVDTAEVNTRADGKVALEVNDDMTSFEAQEVTLVASTDTTITFAQAVRLVKVKNFSTTATVFVRDGAISSDTPTNSEKIGIAPATNVPAVEWFPLNTTTVHLRSAGTPDCVITGFF